MSKPIAYMTPAERATLTPEQMVETILNDNFDRESALSRGMALNLSRDILDCLLASYGAACAAEERARAAQIAQITGTAHAYSAAEHASGFAASDIVVRIVMALGDQPGA